MLHISIKNIVSVFFLIIAKTKEKTMKILLNYLKEIKISEYYVK